MHLMSRRAAMVVVCAAGAVALSVSANAAAENFKVDLTGAQQVPPVDTPAKGSADLTYDPATRMLTWTVTYSGLSAPATMAHFHGPAAAGKNGPVAIWISCEGRVSQ